MKDSIPEEGDIFRWHCTPEEYTRRSKACGSTVYWCKSQIAICKSGRLVDTYWYDGSDSSYVLDLANTQIEFLGNPKDMKRIGGDDRVFYRAEDVVDLRHANNSGGHVYVKGERDPEAMRQYYHEQASRFSREEKMAQDRMADCRNAIAAIDRGELNGNGFYIYR